MAIPSATLDREQAKFVDINSAGVVGVRTTQVASQSSTTVFQTAAVGTANGSVLTATGLGSLAIQVVGITSATVTFEANLDGTNWVAIPAFNRNTGALATTATTDGIYTVDIAGFAQFRARISSYVSGTITVTGMAIAQADGQAIVRAVVQSASGGSSLTYATGPGDGSGNSQTFALIAGFDYMFNGTTWDRLRNNIDLSSVGITAAGVTTTQTGTDQTNYNAKGVKVTLDMTVIGTGSVTLEIDGKDPASGKYFAILTGATVSSNSTNVYTVYPGAAVTANVSASDVLPRIWRVKVTANNANATTYTVGATMIL